VAFILAGLGVRDERILKILLDRLEYDVTDGGLCLGLYGDPAAVGAIEQMMAKLTPEERDLRRELTNAIDEIRSHGSNAGESDSKFDLFDGVPETAGPDFDVLGVEDRLALLSHEAADYRAGAAASFFQHDYPVEVRARLLELARRDADAAVRARSWEALGGIDDKDVRAEMLAILANPAADVVERGGAAVALADDAGKPPVREGVIALYDAPGGRAKAMEAMWRSFDRGFSAWFPGHLDDPDEDIRRSAIFGVGYLGIGSVADRLRKYFDDEDWRADALYAWSLAIPAEISRGRIRGLLKKIDKAADGLSDGETELVQLALDQRLLLHGFEPVFFPDEEGEEHVHDENCGHDHPHDEEPAAPKTPGRNDPCPCGSGKKYKKCHGA
jgi:HEAT repeat protein